MTFSLVGRALSLVSIVSVGSVACLVASLGLTTPVLAHVTLESQEAKVDALYKGVVRVPHGCESSATTSLRMRIPEGVIGVKPRPKPGWTLSTVVAKYPKPVKLYHAELTEGVVEISWAGGKLPDEWYDEFVFTGYLSSELQPGKTLYFPVVQQCEKGVHRWIETPAAGQTRSDMREPAPELRLLPATRP
ncbi:MAG: YcnI family protein [Xanthobacteraceae bacterium]